MGSSSQADERFEFDNDELRSEVCRFLHRCNEVVNQSDPGRQSHPFRAASTSIKVLRGKLWFGETHRLEVPAAMRGRIEQISLWVEDCWRVVFSPDAQAFRSTQEWSLSDTVRDNVLELARDYGVFAFAWPHTVPGTPEFKATQASIADAIDLRAETVTEREVPAGASGTDDWKAVDSLPGDLFRSKATGQQKDLFRWLRHHGRVNIDRLHREFPDWYENQVQEAAVRKALRGLRDNLEPYGEGWRLELTSDETWLVPPK